MRARDRAERVCGEATPRMSLLPCVAYVDETWSQQKLEPCAPRRRLPVYERGAGAGRNAKSFSGRAEGRGGGTEQSAVALAAAADILEQPEAWRIVRRARRL